MTLNDKLTLVTLRFNPIHLCRIIKITDSITKILHCYPRLYRWKIGRNIHITFKSTENIDMVLKNCN